MQIILHLSSTEICFSPVDDWVPWLNIMMRQAAIKNLKLRSLQKFISGQSSLFNVLRRYQAIAAQREE